MFGGHNCNGFEVIQLYPKIYLEKFFKSSWGVCQYFIVAMETEFWQPCFSKFTFFFAMVFILQLIEYCFLKFMMNDYFWLKRYAPN